MILTPAQTPSSRPSPPQPLTATKWNVRVVGVPSAAQIFRWSCVFFDFYIRCVLWSVTFCIERLGHFRICFVVRVTINFVYVGNNFVSNRIHCVCNFHRMVFFADFWCILILRRLFKSLCVSNVFFSLYEFITAILPVLVCFRHRTTTSISVLQHWYHRRSIAAGLAFCTHLYDGPAFSSPAFSTRVNVSRVFQSRVFHPHPVRWSRVFQSRVFSRPNIIRGVCPSVRLSRVAATSTRRDGGDRWTLLPFVFVCPSVS